VTQGFPAVANGGLPAAIPCIERAVRWLAALCIMAGSAGCVLTQDVPDPALDIPRGYQAGSSTDPKRRCPRRLRIATATLIERLAAGGKDFPSSARRRMKKLSHRRRRKS